MTWCQGVITVARLVEKAACNIIKLLSSVTRSKFYLLGETWLSLDPVLGCCCQSLYQRAQSLVEVEGQCVEVGKNPGVRTN